MYPVWEVSQVLIYFNFLLTECKGCMGQYRPNVMAVWTELNKAHGKTRANIPHYSWSTLGLLITYTANFKIPSKKEPIEGVR